MTETGKTEETAELPLEGSPDRRDSKSTDAPSPGQDSVKSDGEESNPSSPAAMPKTPIANRLSLSDANVFKTPDPLTPTSSAKKRKRLTPEEKSLREKERQEKRRKLEEEKQKKEAERLEKARQKEAERLKKEEEKRRSEEEKRLEKIKKEEERKKIEEERKQEKQKKEEERKKIEEERKQEKQKKEEERKKKEDEKRLKEEEKERERLKLEEKKAKQAQFFTNFFQKPSAPKVHTIENGSVKTTIIRPIKHSDGDSSGADSSKKSSLFNPLPFQIKTDMAIAPLVRRPFPENEKRVLDAYLAESSTCADVSKTFFNSIKRGNGRKFGRTETILKESPEIEVLDEEEAKAKPIGCFKWRLKLLQFEENRRPAYWGTWKRKAKKVTARRPFTKETEVDYDFDSDDEWEDEPEDGEEIENSGDEGDDREDGEDAEEDEEGWMVPHGYLSDSEREGRDGGDFEVLKCKEKEFYKSLKEKTQTVFPFIITEDLSCYRMRLCPVFRSANVTKKPVRRKPRAPRNKKKTDEIIKPSMPPPPVPQQPSTPTAVKAASVAVKASPAPVAVKASPAVVKPSPAPVAVKPSPAPTVVKSVLPKAAPVAASAPAAEKVSTPSPKEKQDTRKSGRKRKPVDQKPNPYAKPPSGFLGMELSSDDEEDMDWEEESNSESNSESESEGDEENTSSDSDEDLFIPVRKKDK